MVKIEFNDMTELIEFIEHFGNTVNKKEITTECMARNEKWLHHNDLKESFTTMINLILANRQDSEEEIPEDTVENEIKTIRKYSIVEKQRFPTITNMTRDGKFKLKNKKQNDGIAAYTIEDILKLKSKVYDIENYPTFNSLMGIINVSMFTLRYLCYGIEKGFFDKYIKEWEEIQAKTYESKKQPVPIINNPQKRKERGMI